MGGRGEMIKIRGLMGKGGVSVDNVGFSEKIGVCGVFGQKIGEK